MNPILDQIEHHLAVPLAALVAAAIGLTGCTPAAKDLAGPREVSLAEFSRPGGVAGGVEPGVPTPPLVPAESGATAIGPPPEVQAVTVAADESESGPFIGPGSLNPLMATNVPEAAPLEPGARVIIDRMVGQINGRPVYAEAFFREIDDLLRAKSEELPRREFEREAAKIVADHLRIEVLNALYLAEAESRLTVQQRQGLLGMLGQVRERIVAEYRGSSILASEQLRTEKEMSLDEAVTEWKDTQLIISLLRENVLPRVIVSWRDIEREYERRIDEFNPAPRLVLARIRLNTNRDAELISEIRTRLASGESFESVATSVDQWDEGRWQTFALGPDGIDGVELNEQMKARLGNLEPGQTTEPFELGSSTWWIHMTAIDAPAGRSLYDPEVQRLLDNEIRTRRMAEEQSRYIRSLLEEGIYDELDAMAGRLVDLAIARYAP